MASSSCPNSGAPCAQRWFLVNIMRSQSMVLPWFQIRKASPVSLTHWRTVSISGRPSSRCSRKAGNSTCFRIWIYR